MVVIWKVTRNYITYAYIFATIKYCSQSLALLKSTLKTRTGEKQLILCFSGVEQVSPGSNF